MERMDFGGRSDVERDLEILKRLSDEAKDDWSEDGVLPFMPIPKSSTADACRAFVTDIRERGWVFRFLNALQPGSLRRASR